MIEMILLMNPAMAPPPIAVRPGDAMVVTCGNDVGLQVDSIEGGMEAFRERGELRGGMERVRAHWDAHGPLYGEHGVTAFEPYVKWMLLEPEEGAWDPEFFDAELAEYKEHGLKWAPFLIAGPAYATPPWFKESDESVFAVDIGTGDVSRDQSIWNPHLKPRVRAWLQRFFEHYDHEDMQAALLGISGVFGESIYTAGGNAWTWIWDGHYPQHFGWWCGDEYARAHFRKTMRAKYKSIDRLNEAWGAEYESFGAVEPFVPDDTRVPRARLDMTRWYMGAMTDFAEWWVQTTREIAPDVPVLLCTGGGASAELGADMSAQSKMVAAHGAGMRITNEASDYATNFHITRHISSACRQYGAYFGYEPAGAVNTNGIVARVYNAVAAGAWELFHYDNPPDGERGERYKANLDLLTVREPVVEVGLFWSRTSMDLKRAGDLGALGQQVRDRCDIDYVDELMIEDGGLEGLRMLVWGAGPVTEKATAERIKQAVREGMTLLVPAGWAPESPEGEALFPAEHTTTGRPFMSHSVPYLPDEQTDGVWREGTFYGAEADTLWGTSGRACWTGGPVTFHIPLPEEKCQVRISYRIGPVPRAARILVDDRLQKEAPPNEMGEFIFVPDAGSREITVAFDSATWSPAAAGESDDTRELAVMLREIVVEPVEGQGEPPGPVAQVVKVGRGCVVEAMGYGPGPVAEALGAIVKRPDGYGVAALSAEAAVDGEADHVYVAVTTEEILVYNHGDTAKTVETPKGEVEVEGHTIVSVR